MKAEEMIGKKLTLPEKELKWEARDAIGNILVKGDLITVGYNNMGPIVGRVAEVLKSVPTEAGSVTRTSIVVAFNLDTGREGRLPQILKVANPVSDAMIADLSAKMGQM